MHPTIEKIQKGNLQKVPEVKTGYTVRVSQKVTEGNKERIQNFEGLVIKVSHGQDAEKTFTVRKIVEGIGVEKIFPFHSPNITKIHVVKKAKVRREKLYYMRERFGKSARLSEKHVTDEERAAEEAKMEKLYAEAVKADEKKKAEEEAAKPAEEAAEAPAVEEVTEVPAAEEAKVEEAVEEKAEEKVEEVPAEEKKEEEAPTEEAKVEEAVEEKAEEKVEEVPAEEKKEEEAPTEEVKEESKEEAKDEAPAEEAKEEAPEEKAEAADDEKKEEA